jgi:hypothetical protein
VSGKISVNASALVKLAACCKSALSGCVDWLADVGAFVSKKFMVLVETAGNQKTIFQTNRLSENVGASELIYRVGTEYVLRAVGVDRAKAKETANDPAQLETFLRNL